MQEAVPVCINKGDKQLGAELFNLKTQKMKKFFRQFHGASNPFGDLIRLYL